MPCRIPHRDTDGGERCKDAGDEAAHGHAHPALVEAGEAKGKAVHLQGYTASFSNPSDLLDIC